LSKSRSIALPLSPVEGLRITNNAYRFAPAGGGCARISGASAMAGRRVVSQQLAAGLFHRLATTAFQAFAGLVEAAEFMTATLTGTFNFHEFANSRSLEGFYTGFRCAQDVEALSQCRPFSDVFG